MIRDKRTLRIVEITLYCPSCKRFALFRRGEAGLACYLCGGDVKAFAGIAP